MEHLIPIEISEAITTIVSRAAPGAITSFTAAHGGCINHGGTIHTTNGDFFLKWNEASRLNGMFESEARGLQLLRATRAIHVPEVVSTGHTGKYQYLLLENIAAESQRGDYWETLGRQLAKLHRSQHSHYGLDHNNYIGSIPQSNEPLSSWREFFQNRRLKPLLDLAIRKGLAPSRWNERFELLFKRFDGLLPEEPASLVHGDLWQGNVIVNTLGAPCLIDPAVYYGHREVDLAMTKLFGDFDRSFYAAYNEEYPLLPGSAERFEIYNLYPLLVHLLLFGATYVAPIQSTLEVVLSR
ncbi:fructosamine kinase family protein [Chryseolinea sp. T2]|uniref:fructosamine kinase family protein n=1 Tax=Chryseolinea sp. T2 TaxID=3129255 RepID=UPI0030770C26